MPPAAKRQRGDAASGVNAYARLQVTCCRTEDRLGWEVRAGLARGVEGTPSTLGPVYFWGGPVYFSGGPVYFWGGPVYFWCGPVYFWGGPAYLLGGPVYYLGGACLPERMHPPAPPHPEPFRRSQCGSLRRRGTPPGRRRCLNRLRARHLVARRRRGSLCRKLTEQVRRLPVRRHHHGRGQHPWPGRAPLLPRTLPGRAGAPATHRR